jgi:hydrophobic/amphiphilic exporter-1 (mainly G- bacteria), HAE1 family
LNLADLSIKRPIFVTCVFVLILGLGLLAGRNLGVSLYPNVTFPVVTITVPYPGTGPKEMESLVARPIEDELSTLAGVNAIRSTNEDGVSIVSAEFTMDTDIRFAEQKVSQSVSRIRGKLPSDIKDPVVQSVDPSDTPVMVLSLTAELAEGALFDLADQEVKPRLEQLPKVGLVEIEGGRKREIGVELDENKLKSYELSATQVANQIAQTGGDVPAGKIENPETQTLVRTVGQFDSVNAIKKTVIRFLGNEALTTVGDVSRVQDALEDEKTRTYVDGKRALTLFVYRQSGANTVAVGDEVTNKVAEINQSFGKRVAGFEVSIVRDGARPIRESVNDVRTTILLGVVLTIFVVLFFLGNIRSTLITGIALPNSLLGAFLLMWLAGFTANITTLSALALAVGLLVDDAIVVRENIFRRIEAGESPELAASLGTREVTLAVVATTLTVLSVFGPLAFLQGIIGQFFRQFGLTICFAMTISLFDSLTMAPMLSTYFSGKPRPAREGRFRFFQAAQGTTRRGYFKILGFTLDHPLLVLGAAVLIFGASLFVFLKLPKSFVPSQEAGELLVVMDMPAGTSLSAMDELANSIDRKIRSHREVKKTLLTSGGRNGEANEASLAVLLTASKDRKLSTTQMKEVLRTDLRGYPQAVSKVQDFDAIGSGGSQPLNLNLIGEDLDQLKSLSDSLVKHLKESPDLKDVDTNYRIGAPELQVSIKKARAGEYGISSLQVGQELRTLIAGSTPAKFREGGRQYDIRVRLRKDQRDLRETFPKISIPNLNNRMIPFPDVSALVETQGPSTIYRQDRSRYIQISADLNPHGGGLSHAVQEIRHLFDSGAIKLPAGTRYEFVGQTKDFQDLLMSMAKAIGLAIAFMYLILSSLYESFFIPFSIMLVLPLAACGAFYALALTGSTLDIYSIIGCVLLLGVAAKNSILLVDYINQEVKKGKDVRSAILAAGNVRLRPIMMTSVALIAGMLPVAIGLTEYSKQRTSMGVAVIGGLVSSTLLSLVVVPAAYRYIERFQNWALRFFRKFF